MPTPDDLAIATTIADELIKESRWASIMHDVRKRSRMGSCPLRYYYARKNLVGVPIYQNPERAREWIIKALMLGYVVLGHSRKITVAWASSYSIAKARQ